MFLWYGEDLIELPLAIAGIGLAMCRKITQNHQGKIYATSEPGQGSTFHILLPLQHQQATH